MCPLRVARCGFRVKDVLKPATRNRVFSLQPQPAQQLYTDGVAYGDGPFGAELLAAKTADAGFVVDAHRPLPAGLADAVCGTGLHAHTAALAGLPAELGRDASQLFTCLSALKLELSAQFPGTAFNIGYFESGQRVAINVIPHQATGIIDVRPSAELQQRGAAYIASRAAALVHLQDLVLSHQVTIDMKPLAVEASQLGSLEQVLKLNSE